MHVYPREIGSPKLKENVLLCKLDILEIKLGFHVEIGSPSRVRRRLQILPHKKNSLDPGLGTREFLVIRCLWLVLPWLFGLGDCFTTLCYI